MRRPSSYTDEKRVYWLLFALTRTTLYALFIHGFIFGFVNFFFGSGSSLRSFAHESDGDRQCHQVQYHQN
ncbi:Uncharacterised protein [Escherichia coli]|uniref:Uncharacterized protein n=1 Tax=Escherichia coli TaxID=562 RepID=A0A3S4NRW6_ECOLX|nr:Uncharacterised protein [Escherichia coli]